MPNRSRILVVDDDAVIRDLISELLGSDGHHVSQAAGGAEALDLLAKQRFDLVLCDLKMPVKDGIELGGLDFLRLASGIAPGLLTVMMTGFGTIETAVSAMKLGAYDFVLKPFKLDDVRRVVQRGLEHQAVQAENLRLREALTLYEVSEAIAASLSLDQVLDTVAKACFRDLGADAVWTWLEDSTGVWFERQALGRDSAHPPGRLHASEVVARMQGGAALRSDASAVLLEQGSSTESFFSEAPGLRPSSFVAAHLRSNNRVVGFMALAIFEDPPAPTPTLEGRRFTEGQRKLLSILSARAAAAIENARLFESLERSFQQTIEGLASAIDKMDRYTAGHSERVADYAVLIANKLGLSDEEIAVVRHSALMHDIGKIGCVLKLNKPTRLTSDEYEAFKHHPRYGKEILEPIEFLRPLIPGVYAHHERWDGHGYPEGLSGDTIPLIARIISVADTYDAMTSDRSYRRALPHEVSTAELERCAGSQFDPELARVFLREIERFREEARAQQRSIPV